MGREDGLPSVTDCCAPGNGKLLVKGACRFYDSRKRGGFGCPCMKSSKEGLQ